MIPSAESSACAVPLPEFADTLLGDPARLESLSRLGLEWWRAMCSPEAVGRYMAREIVGRLKAI